MPTNTVTGDEAIRRALAALPDRILRKLARKALRVGAKVVQAEAKADAPEGTGRTRRAIKVRAGKRRRKGSISLAVIIGKGDFKGVDFYGAFEDFGWHTGKRGSKDRRKVEGKHFMERALATKETEAKAVISDQIAEGLDREITALKQSS